MSVGLKRSERGDTIIEVLFAMSIIAVVLGAAYATASRNLQTNQLAKERIEATQLAESQIEQLKALKDTPAIDDFCVDLNQTNPVLASSDAACTVRGLFEREITKTNDTEYEVTVTWDEPGGSSGTERANVTLVYKDFDENTAGVGSGINLFESVAYDPATGAVTLGVNIISSPEFAGFERGIVYGTGENPLITDGSYTRVPGGTSANNFTELVQSLDPTQTYYFKAYVDTVNADFYSSVLVINGDGATGLSAPSVVTLNPSSVSFTTARVGGNVTSNGGAAITRRGIVYSTSTTPTVDAAGDITRNSPTNGTGSYDFNLSGLSEGTRYYVRAFAFNGVSASPTYGAQRSFTTSARQRPTASVSFVSDTYTTARLRLNVTDDGDSPINLAYVDIHTNSNFVNSSGSGRSRVTLANRTGTQNADFSGLLPNKRYYYRAVVRNGKGETVTSPIRSFVTDAMGSGYTSQRDLGRSRYYRSTTSESWGAANARAIGRGGNLVDIRNGTENNLVSGMAPVGGNGVWIGLNDAAREGTFIWSSGSSATYRRWQSSPTQQPDNFNNQDYVITNFRFSGQWNDAGASLRTQAIFEFRESLRWYY